jgi:hypothetical protein
VYNECTGMHYYRNKDESRPLWRFDLLAIDPLSGPFSFAAASVVYCALTPFPLCFHQGQKSRRAVFCFKLAYCSPLAVKSGQLFAAVIQMADSKEPPVSGQLSSARR